MNPEKMQCGGLTLTPKTRVRGWFPNLGRDGEIGGKLEGKGTCQEGPTKKGGRFVDWDYNSERTRKIAKAPPTPRNCFG